VHEDHGPAAAGDAIGNIDVADANRGGDMAVNAIAPLHAPTPEWPNADPPPALIGDRILMDNCRQPYHSTIMIMIFLSAVSIRHAT
jgi:hypothetical protein